MIELNAIRTVAAKEFRDRLRNRWVLAVSVVFTLFALVIAYFGAAQQGEVGLRGIEVTIASLVSLVIYLIPLIALLLGFDAIVGERERGSLELMLSLPISRAELILGKYGGLAAALSVATLTGFGLAGALLVTRLPAAALYHYAGFMLSALLLGLAFLSLAVLVSVLAGDRTRASGAAIALWFFFVLIFDLLLLGLLVVQGDGPLGEWLPYLMLLNPADLFRALNIFSSDELRSFYGLGSVLPDLMTQPLMLGGMLTGWIVAPLAAALWRFR
ncbi:ABC transporter permease [Pseudogulbenkiania sp. MAI-1]|uniref:ABC transporter permease n=1 Tax=Pseudogulbenkiania sp. MAI-1 TaxID=990370 RepID=UPI0004B55377|nr:ABC transporter permease subunit [Pseudogulbenkiania sp. MAI-1]